MWPDLFNAGWGWGALFSALVLGALVALVASIGRRSWRPSEPVDRLGLSGSIPTMQELWHRYEIGDLTRWEFERMRAHRVAPAVPPLDSGSAAQAGRSRYAA